MAMVVWGLSSMIQWPSRESARAPRSHPLHARRIRVREGRRDHQTSSSPRSRKTAARRNSWRRISPLWPRCAALPKLSSNGRLDILINNAGIGTGGSGAPRQTSADGHADRCKFAVVDCSGQLAFADGAFVAVLCIDAISHLPDRFGTLSEWARLLVRGGRLLFTDSSVLTGAIAKSELDMGRRRPATISACPSTAAISAASRG
jgi:SAM-dependent methyltransferase